MLPLSIHPPPKTLSLSGKAQWLSKSFIFFMSAYGSGTLSLILHHQKVIFTFKKLLLCLGCYSAYLLYLIKVQVILTGGPAGPELPSLPRPPYGKQI